MELKICEFCLLVSNKDDEETKRIIIDESQNVVAFRSMVPSADIHVMVISKAHVASILDADDDLLLEFMSMVKKVAADLTEEHGACKVMTNIGKYQIAKHLHWHITYNYEDEE